MIDDLDNTILWIVISYTNIYLLDGIMQYKVLNFNIFLTKNSMRAYYFFVVYW